MKVKDIVDLPEKVTRLCSHTENDECCVACMSHDLINGTIDKCGDLPISKDKVIGMVEFDREKLAKLIHNLAWPSSTWERQIDLVKERYYKRADAIIAAKSDILTIKGDV